VSSPREIAAAAPVAAEDRAAQLFGLLRSTSHLRLFVDGSSAVLKLLALLVAVGLAAILADAVLAFPTAVRVALDVMMAIAALALLALIVRRAIANRYDPRRAARLVESRLGLSDNLFINAVEFAEPTASHSSEQLRTRAIRMADERSRDVSALDVLPLRPLWKACGLAAVVLAVVLAGWFAAPRLFAMVVPRYLDPAGDHPPFTLVTFDVVVSPEPVYRGKPASITVTLGGPEVVDDANVVFLPREAGDESRSQPMFRREDQSFALELERPEASERFYIDTPQGRSPTLDLTVVEVPFFEHIAVRYDYPSYTGWLAHEQPLDQRGLRGIVGTEVTLTVTSNLPLAEGRVSLRPAAPADATAAKPVVHTLLPLASDSRTVTGRFPMRESGEFDIQLRATNGGESVENVTGRILVQPDRPPRVAISQPQPHVIAVADWQVPVTIDAVDDVGIATLRLSRSVNGWGPSTVDVPITSPRAGAVQGTALFDLGELGAASGDVITYYATAGDNHPDPTQFADSEICVIQVISQEDYLQFARQQYQLDDLANELDAIQQQVEELQAEREKVLEELAALEKESAASPDSPETLQKMQAAQEQLQKHTEALDKLAKQLEERANEAQLYDVEQPFSEMLQQLAEQQQQQSESADAVAEALQRLQKNPTDPTAREEFAEQLAKMQQEQAGLDDEAREQLAAAEQDLELFQQADAMLAQTERLQSIIQQQRELATRLGEYRNQEALTPEEQDRADDLARQQELLEQDLQDVARELQAAGDAAAERLPQMSASAQQIASAIRDQKIPEDQQQSASSARAGAGREAHTKAESAAEKLEALAQSCSNCQGAAGEMSGGLDGPLSLSRDGIQNTLEQLAQGRSIPGAGRPGQGQKPGSQPGDGTAGSAGSQGTPMDGEGQQPGDWRPGQSFPGSQAQLPILGPRMELENAQERRQPAGELGNDEHGGFTPGSLGSDPAAAESLTPEARASRSGTAGLLRGVPVPYRREAEAYFRRLAEDEAAP
jgi:hypothetical protein